MWQKFTQDLLPTEVNIVNLGVSAQSLSGSSGLLVRDLTAVDNLKKQYDSVSPFIVGVFAGTNDLASLSRSTTQVYGDLQTYNTNRQAAGEKSIVFTILPRNSINANRDTVNGCIRDGFSGTNAGCGGGQLPANAIVYAGFDPNMGQDNQTSTSWFSSDGVHPSNAGYALIATYVAPAVMRAIGTPSAPVWLRFTVSNNGTSTWTIAPNGNTAGPSIAIPSATSSSIPIYYLGPKYKLCGAELKTTTQFSATGLTTLQATIGDSVGGSTFYSSSQYNMMTAPGATNFQDTQILNSKTWAGSNVTLEINGANQNLNAQSNLAGAIDVSLCVTSVP
jgi:lysophospholipase L1-like esterase